MKNIYKNRLVRVLISVFGAMLSVLAFSMVGGSNEIPASILEKIGDNRIFRGVLHIKNSIRTTEIFSLVLFCVLSIFYNQIFQTVLARTKKIAYCIFSISVSVIFLLCESFYKTDSWDMLFESSSAFLIAIIRCAGISFLVYAMILFVNSIEWKSLYFKTINKCNIEKTFKHEIVKWSGLFFLAWVPYIVLLFPGCFTLDAQDEIAQIYGNRDYCWSIRGMILLDDNVILNNHHPVFYTQLLRCVLAFGRLIGSYEWAFEIYCILQCAFLASILAYLITVISKKNVSKVVRNVFVAFFALNPVIPIYGMTIVKDTLFACFFCLGIVLLYEVLGRKKWSWLKGTALSIDLLFLMLSRNNGLYIVCGLLVILAIVLWKKREKLWRMACVLVVPILIFQIGINGIIYPYFNVTPGSVREIFSVPFQQTARYVKEYGDEISKEDAEIICKVLLKDGDIQQIADNYVPERADNVKNNFNKYCTTDDIKEYLIVWAKGFIKHPLVYIEAFLNLNYSWFSFYSTQDGIIYAGADELDLPILVNGFEGAGGNQFIRTCVYESVQLLSRLPGINILVEFSSYTWLYLYLFIRMVKNHNWKALAVSSPVYINYLICFVGPVAYMRYALPMLLCAPLIVFIVLVNDKVDDLDELEEKDEKYENIFQR